MAHPIFLVNFAYQRWLTIVMITGCTIQRRLKSLNVFSENKGRKMDFWIAAIESV